MSFKIDGYIFDRDDNNFNEALSAAYAKKDRPLCCCTDEGIEMYIARTGNDQYILKRMPNSGHRHNIECSSFEIPPELSGRGDLERSAIAEDIETGISNIKLDFSLAKYGAKRAPIIGDTTEKSVVKSDPKKMSIKSLLHCLWENSSLNKWVPAMEKKRNWNVIRKHIYRAAHGLAAKGNPLYEVLFLPESFSVERKNDIYLRRMHFLSKFKKIGNKTPMGILVGEVKEIDSARFGYKMTIKHLPDLPVFMGDDVFKRVNKVFEKELSFFAEHDDIHLLAISTFTLTASGNPQIENISLITLDKNWIPFESLEEKYFLDTLYQDRKSFIKGLRYNLPSDDIIASVLLTSSEEPEAVYLVPVGASSDYFQKLDLVTDESEIKHNIIDYNSLEMTD